MKLSFIKYHWTIAFFNLTIISCGQTTKTQATTTIPTPTTAIIQQYQPVDTSLIAFIPFSKKGNWSFDSTYSPSTLSQIDIEKIEKLLTDCVNDYNKQLSNGNIKSRSIDLSKGKYKRQYVAAVNKNGDKEVWVNCLCHIYDDQWKTTIILVEDGGSCYFNLRINLTKELYYDLAVNGNG